ncbi:MAG: Do family serine endopeptidase [Bacteriodetes bacterium]|nr:Do family serine endopeptidase [Bacteroidota bacterium]
MNKRPALIATALIGVGVVVGVILVTVFSGGSIGSLFAGGINDIGAKSAPVKVSDNVRMLNDAFVAASKAVSPTVVSINVTTEKKVVGGNGDLRNFFRFFGDPRMNPDDQGNGGDDGTTERGEGSGSGVVISADGYIVTNNHVVEDAKEDGIKVMMEDKHEYKAKLIGKDPLTDLAVIKIDASGLTPAFLGTPEDIQIGEWVIAVGNPLGLRSTITQGIISAIGRGGLGLNKGDFAVENFIQTDAAINPGNSGGGLFSLNGALIGINSAIATRTGYYQGYGFAIPIDIVKSVVLDLINNGKVSRAYIGVTIKAVDEKDAKAFGLSKVTGVVAQEVLKDSPAKKAGIESGDVLLELNGTPLTSANQLQSLVLVRKPGEKVKIKIWRDGKEMMKDVILQARDKDIASADKGVKGDSDMNESDSNEPVSMKSLGFSVGPLTDQAKKEAEVTGGVLVTKVDNYSEASDRNLVKGCVIVKADRKEVNSPAQLKKIIDSKRPGDVILLDVKVKDRRGLISLEVPDSKN